MILNEQSWKRFNTREHLAMFPSLIHCGQQTKQFHWHFIYPAAEIEVCCLYSHAQKIKTGCHRTVSATQQTEKVTLKDNSKKHANTQTTQRDNCENSKWGTPNKCKIALCHSKRHLLKLNIQVWNSPIHGTMTDVVLLRTGEKFSSLFTTSTTSLLFFRH